MTKFEEVSNILNKSDSADLHENCIYWLNGDKYATVNVDRNSRYATRIKKLAEKYPTEVRIFSESGGYILAGVPVKSVKISIIEGREMSEEQKQLLREGAENYRRSKLNSAQSDEGAKFGS